MSPPSRSGLVKQAVAGDQEALAALREAMPEHKAGFQALLGNPVDAHRRIVAVLRAWAQVFSAIEPRAA